MAKEPKKRQKEDFPPPNERELEGMKQFIQMALILKQQLQQSNPERFAQIMQRAAQLKRRQ